MKSQHHGVVLLTAGLDGGDTIIFVPMGTKMQTSLVARSNYQKPVLHIYSADVVIGPYNLPRRR